MKRLIIIYSILILISCGSNDKKKKGFEYNRTQKEIKKCERRKETDSCYAKRFAAKEAAAKALGTGFRKGVFWKDLEVNNFPSGEPTVIFHGKSREHLDRLISGSKSNIKLTITDEYPYAQGIVIIDG